MPNNRVHDAVVSLSREGRLDQLPDVLRQLAVSDLNPEEHEMWFHYQYVAAMQAQPLPQAVQWLNQGIALFPDSGLLQYDLAQEQIRDRQFEHAFRSFQKCSVASTGPVGMLHVSRILYLHFGAQPALDALNGFWGFYESIGYSEAAARAANCPAFDVFIRYFLAFSALCDSAQGSRVLERSRECLSIEGYQLVCSEWEALVNRNWHGLLAALDLRSNADASIYRMIVSSEKILQEAALAGLDALSVVPDFLVAAVELARIRLAYRARRSANFKSQLISFLEAFPLWLSPDVAFSTGLWMFQDQWVAFFRSKRF